MSKKKLQPVSYLFSRYGGHQMVGVEGKLSNKSIPPEASFEEIMDTLATPMSCFDYLSSYKYKPYFMDSFDMMPQGSVKIGMLHHEQTELSFQFEVEVCSHLYLTPTELPHVYMLTLRTDYTNIEWYIGKIPSSYDMVLCFRFRDMTEKEIKAHLGQILACMVSLLLFEMEAQEYPFEFIPARTVWGKRFDEKSFKKTMKIVKSARSAEELAKKISLFSEKESARTKKKSIGDVSKK